MTTRKPECNRLRFTHHLYAPKRLVTSTSYVRTSAMLSSTDVAQPELCLDRSSASSPARTRFRAIGHCWMKKQHPTRTAVYSRLCLRIISNELCCGTKSVKVVKVDLVQISFSAVMADFDLCSDRQKIVVMVDRDIVVVHAD